MELGVYQLLSWIGLIISSACFVGGLSRAFPSDRVRVVIFLFLVVLGLVASCLPRAKKWIAPSLLVIAFGIGLAYL